MATDAVALLPSPPVAPPVVPPELCCCITYHLLRDPVVTAIGHTYERAAIETAWRGQEATALRDPLTNEVVPSDVLVPNWIVRKQVQSFLDAHPPPYVPDGWTDRTVPPARVSPATPRPVTVGFLEPRLAALEAATSLFACLLTSLSVGLASGHARSVFQAARAAAAPRSSAYFDAFGWASRLVSRVGLVTAQRPPAPPPPPGVAALARQHPAQFVFAACYVVAACAAFSWTCCEHLPKAWAGAGRLLSDVYRFTTWSVAALFLPSMWQDGTNFVLRCIILPKLVKSGDIALSHDLLFRIGLGFVLILWSLIIAKSTTSHCIPCVFTCLPYVGMCACVGAALSCLLQLDQTYLALRSVVTSRPRACPSLAATYPRALGLPLLLAASLAPAAFAASVVNAPALRTAAAAVRNLALCTGAFELPLESEAEAKSLRKMFAAALTGVGPRLEAAAPTARVVLFSAAVFKAVLAITAPPAVGPRAERFLLFLFSLALLPIPPTGHALVSSFSLHVDLAAGELRGLAGRLWHLFAKR